ncbi:hypothetical protein ACI5KX_05395 [Erythrobacter sp. GH1-10]|uniref:hypothetical protein n=1 Tax=Erythrobacter sp. GH1-10 TaxID=3349334 RepID=UPI003877C65C
MKNLQRTLVLGASIVALAGCGADEIVSPGTSGDIIINNPSPSPTPTPTPTGGATVTAAAGCPTISSTGGLEDRGVLSNTPTGDYRVCRLPATFNVDDSLPRIDGLLYEISGRVNVGTDQGFSSTGTDVTLNVDPGVIFFAQAESFLVVNRGNTIEANGTETMPIIWTSRDNVLGVASDNSQAQWGGVVLLGRAPVSDCSNLVFNTAAAPNANPQCEQQLEGTVVATPFGGTDSADSSGSMTYNQIRFSGFELQQSNELQSLTTGGTGSGTTLENILSFNSSDDGVEFFGGSVNIKNLAVIGASDDSLDVDSGAQANVETVVVVQRSGTGDSLIEFDSPDDLADGTPGNALPQSRLQVNNFTFVQRSSSSSQAIRARGGPALGLTNGVIDVDTADDVCIRIDETITLNAIIGFDSIVCDGANRPVRGSSGVADADVQAVVDAGTNNNLLATLTLTNTLVNGTFENGITSFDPTARSSFFTDFGFIGAENDDITDNFGDWTCNSSIMDFGSATGACTSLPVY